MVNPKKSKELAIALAIFFSFGSWVYTWKYNHGKFLIAAGILIFTIGFFEQFTIWAVLLILIWAISDNSLKSVQWYKTYYKK